MNKEITVGLSAISMVFGILASTLLGAYYVILGSIPGLSAYYLGAIVAGGVLIGYLFKGKDMPSLGFIGPIAVSVVTWLIGFIMTNMPLFKSGQPFVLTLLAQLEVIIAILAIIGCVLFGAGLYTAGQIVISIWLGISFISFLLNFIGEADLPIMQTAVFLCFLSACCCVVSMFTLNYLLPIKTSQGSMTAKKTTEHTKNTQLSIDEMSRKKKRLDEWLKYGMITQEDYQRLLDELNGSRGNFSKEVIAKRIEELNALMRTGSISKVEYDRRYSEILDLGE